MLLYINAKKSDGGCSWQASVYGLLRELNYQIINTGNSFLKVDTSKKTAVEVKDCVQLAIDCKSSISSLRQLLNTP